MLKGYFSYLYENTARNSGLAVYDMLENNTKANLLDCGCWDGINTKRFGNIIGTKNLYGIELSQNKSKEASKRGVKVKINDLNKKFEYPSNYFDVVVAYHVIEHLVNVRLFASEIHRVLKKGGYVLIGTPNLASWHNVFALILGLQPFSGPTIKPDYESELRVIKDINKERMKRVFSDESETLDHVKVMTTRALIGLLEDSNFKVEKLRGFGYYPLPPLLANGMSRADPYHSHYIVIKARK